MDLHVEKQCIDQMKGADPKKFMMLFDAYFDSVYKYVSRRVQDTKELEKIVKLTFLDASGQIQNTPTDTAYVVWLYSLAKPRTTSYINKAVFPKKQGLINSKKGHVLPGQEGEKVVEKAENLFKKMTMEEAEILRLKFFEKLADGDIHFVIGGKDALIGPKIYRVLKRAHFLLFGESDQRQGVYFGELSGFMERVKDFEKIEISEAFKLGLRMDLLNKFDRKESALESENFEEVKNSQNGESSAPWKEIDKDKEPVSTGTGSNDPAKVFVQAVKEMREEEQARKTNQMEEFDKTEKVLEVFDKVKGILILIPVLMFLLVVFFVGRMFLFGDEKIDRGIKGWCDFDTSFVGNFKTSEKISIDAVVSKAICENFEPKDIIVQKASEKGGIIEVTVDLEGEILLYDFVKKDSSWKMVKYAKITNSDTESRKIQRNI